VTKQQHEQQQQRWHQAASGTGKHYETTGTSNRILDSYFASSAVAPAISTAFARDSYEPMLHQWQNRKWISVWVSKLVFGTFAYIKCLVVS
jgi:hypothetical protein